MPKARIFVLAGPNGAGKSSVIGEAVLDQGLAFFNPDEAAREVMAADPDLTLEEAEVQAWHEGKRLLERAIQQGYNFAFETTLGGRTIAQLLEDCLDSGGEVVMWYVCLANVELHIERVRSRVKAGGHNIPEDRIRKRYAKSQENLARLLPKLTQLRVYDNSVDNDPKAGGIPAPRLILHTESGTFVGGCRDDDVPDWARPIVEKAVRR